MRQHGLVGPCLGKGANHKEIFLQVAGQYLIALSIYFYETRLLVISERGYTILEAFADPVNPRFFNAL